MRTDDLKWERLPDLPDAEGFAGSYAGVHGEMLLVAGGANFPENGRMQYLPCVPELNNGKKLEHSPNHSATELRFPCPWE